MQRAMGKKAKVEGGGAAAGLGPKGLRPEGGGGGVRKAE